MAFTTPDTDDFKERFDRDFPYAVPAGEPAEGDDTQLDKVRDTDIQRGLNGAAINFNAGLFADQASYQEAYLLLAAHKMVMNLLASTQGLSGQFTWLADTKKAAGVEGKYIIPERIQKSPFLASLSLTRYGAAYLEIISPLLIGNMSLAATTGAEPV